MRRNETYNLHVVIRPSQDLPGKWVAHCLDVDVVTYGDSLAHSIEMAQEAVEMVFVDDLLAGRNPLDRRAPLELWDEMFKSLMPKTVASSLAEVLKKADKVSYVILEPTLVLQILNKRQTAAPKMDVPVAFAPRAVCPAC